MSRLLIAFLAAGLGVLVACAPEEALPPEREPAAQRLAWPPPPEPARIIYERSVSGAGDWSIRRSLAQRLVDAVTGEAPRRLVRPTGVAQHAGVLCVADPGAAALWIFDAPRNRSIRVTQAKDVRLASPVAVAMRPDGGIYVADTVLGAVFLFDREGGLVRVAAREGIERPSGIAYDPRSDRLYVGDSVANRIMAFDASARRVAQWGEPGRANGQFNRPTHLAFTASDALLVTDSLNFRIQAFDTAGRFLWTLGHHGDGSGDLAAPKGVASDHEGHVYVADALFDTVQIFDAGGAFLLAFGEHGAAPGELALPGGIFIGPDDDIYVADAYNGRIVIFGRPATGDGRASR